MGIFSCHDNQIDKELEDAIKSTKTMGSPGSCTLGIGSLSDCSLSFDIGNGNDFTVYANAVPSDGFRIYSFSVRMISLGSDGGEWTINHVFDFDSNGDYSEEFNMYRGGKYKLIGVVSFQNIEDENEIKEVETDEVILRVDYPDRDTVEEWVKYDMDDVWDTSISIGNQNERREFGFLIYMTNDPGYPGILIEKGETLQGDTNDCPTDGELTYNLNFTFTEYALSDIDPTQEGAKYVVGIFHTHPPLTQCDSNVKRKDGVGPSIPDKSFINTMDPYVPAFVYDYSEDIKGGHSADAEAKIYPYGPDRRKDF